METANNINKLKTALGKHGEAIVLALSYLFFVVGVFFLRIYLSGYVFGSENYHHIIIAKNIHQNGHWFIAGNSASPFHALIAFLGGVFGFDYVNLIFPLVIISLVFFVLFLILRKTDIFDTQQRILFFLVLFLSPATTYSALVLNYFTIIALLIFSGIYFYFIERKLLSIVFFLSASFFNPLVFFIVLVLFLSFGFLRDKRKSIRLASVFSLLLSFVLLLSALYFDFLYSGRPLFSSHGNIFQMLFSDVGTVESTGGISSFGFCLFVLGFTLFWRNKRRYGAAISALFVIVFLMLISDWEFILLLNFAVAFFSAFAISYLIKRKWQLSFIRNSVLLSVFLGLLFSYFTYSSHVVYAYPNNSLVPALLVVHRQQDCSVLSDPLYGYWIEYFSGKNPLLNSGLQNPLRKELSILYTSRDIGKIRSILDKHNVCVLLLTSDMKDKMLYKGKYPGLPFVLENSKCFSKLFLNKEGNIEVWKYNPNC